MTKENFEGLLESVRDAGKILRGEIEPSREFWIEVPEISSRHEGYALCIETDDPQLLIPSKIYRARFSASGRVGVIDEEGEAAVYPPEFFVEVKLPAEVEQILEHLQEAA